MSFRDKVLKGAAAYGGYRVLFGSKADRDAMLQEGDQDFAETFGSTFTVIVKLAGCLIGFILPLCLEIKPDEPYGFWPRFMAALVMGWLGFRWAVGLFCTFLILGAFALLGVFCR